MQPKELKYKELPGLSMRQLSEHHDVLYAGYIKKVNEIAERLKTADMESANATYSEIRELKLEYGFALNGVLLHELYFDNMGKNAEITEKVKKKLENDFGSVENWQEELLALGIASRGWVVLAEIDNHLEHYICDVHNQGGVWGAKPILVLDVYEHAYFLDYGTDRKSYLENFIRNIDWKIIEKKFS